MPKNKNSFHFSMTIKCNFMSKIKLHKANKNTNMKMSLKIWDFEVLKLVVKLFLLKARHLFEKRW